MAEEEAMLLNQKASEAEQEITRIRLNNMKTEEEKVHLERKTREAELLTERLVQESERRAAEAEKLKDELLRARIAEKEAKEKLLEFLSRNAYAATIAVIVTDFRFNVAHFATFKFNTVNNLFLFFFSQYQIYSHRRKYFHQIYKQIFRHCNWMQNLYQLI